MPEIFRTNSPLQYSALDGVITSEIAPPLGVLRSGANNTFFLGRFQKGPANDPTLIASVAELQEKFGSGYPGNEALRLKRWSNVYILRVVAANAIKAKADLENSANVTLLVLTAKDSGKYGNTITVAISEGTMASTKKLTVKQGEVIEVFDNLKTAGLDNAALAALIPSNLVVATEAHATLQPEDLDETALTGGTDGTVAGTDYATALENAGVPVSGKIFFADNQAADVKAALSNHIKLNQDGICVLGPENLTTSVDDAVTDAQTYQDTNGRVLYAYNPPGFLVGSEVVYESPVFLLSSILNNSSPHVSPSAAQNSEFTQTAVRVRKNLSRADLIKCKDAGIMAFENDIDLGVRIVSPVTGDPNTSVLRRRMSDFYIASVARFLKNYQGQPNSMITRAAIKSAIVNFDDGLINDGILPSDAELEDGGKARLIKTEGITSDVEKARGILKVEIKRRLFASARFIVLIAEIGESVTISEE